MKAILCLALCCSLSQSIIPQTSVPTVQKESAPRKSPQYAWKYKIENGMLYGRRYRVDTGQWVGDWILL